MLLQIICNKYFYTSLSPLSRKKRPWDYISTSYMPLSAFQTAGSCRGRSPELVAGVVNFESGIYNDPLRIHK